tara:strand:- start:129 stop:245 length:117 start_codon:yes stop_codon:yes gene_type:complete
MEEIGIMGFVFGLGALGKIIILEKKTQRIWALERTGKI